MISSAWRNFSFRRSFSRFKEASFFAADGFPGDGFLLDFFEDDNDSSRS
jgi:hypothetical protein